MLKRYEDAIKMDPSWMKNCKPEHRKMFLDNSVMRRDLLVEKLDAVIDYKKTINVDLKTIDSLTLERVDFIKIDVEGM